MSTSETDARRRRTAWLMSAGAACLILPLLGALYLRFADARASRPSNASLLFERREAGEAKLNPAQTVVMDVPLARPLPTEQPGRQPAGAPSSLSFVKGGEDYFQEKKKAEAPAASTAPVPAASSAAAPSAAKVKKEFKMPKLQAGKGFTNFRGAEAKSAEGADMQDLLKSLPPGSESNPELQKLLKSQAP